MTCLHPLVTVTHVRPDCLPQNVKRALKQLKLLRNMYNNTFVRLGVNYLHVLMSKMSLNFRITVVKIFLVFNLLCKFCYTLRTNHSKQQRTKIIESYIQSTYSVHNYKPKTKLCSNENRKNQFNQ